MMNKLAIVLLAVAAAGLTGCATQQQYQQALHANKALQSELDDLAGAYAELEADRDRMVGLYEDAAASAKDAAWLRKRTEELNDLLSRFRADTIDIEGVDVRSTAEGTVFDVEGEVLFQSGSTQLTDKGIETLTKLSSVLTGDGRPLRIQGHTDSDPIRRSQWRSNLHLSAARALAVAESLTTAGIPAEKVSVAGYGPHLPRPNNPGTDPESRKKWNRRVEILLVGQGAIPGAGDSTGR